MRFSASGFVHGLSHEDPRRAGNLAFTSVRYPRRHGRFLDALDALRPLWMPLLVLSLGAVTGVALLALGGLSRSLSRGVMPAKRRVMRVGEPGGIEPTTL
jgi:hypothetical protein